MLDGSNCIVCRSSRSFTARVRHPIGEGALVFEDGYYCFATREFVPEAVKHMTRVPSKYPIDSFNGRCEVQTKLLESILGDIQPAFLNYLARGLKYYIDM
jgi:hypothetical protein